MLRVPRVASLPVSLSALPLIGVARGGLIGYGFLVRIFSCLMVCLFFAGSASAKLCGDDVDGVDVPCACGDTVVGDLVIDGDPVTEAVCEGNGLLVKAAGLAPLQIDLAGHLIRGAGRGQGVMVLFGGEGGARIVSSGSSAMLSGFETGVVALGANTLQLLDNIVVADAKRDGVRVRSDGCTIRNSEVRRAGRDGFALAGRNYHSVGNRSDASKRHGFQIMGQAGTLSDDVALGSGGAGFQVTGGGHSISGCQARNGVRSGLHLAATKVSIEGCLAEANRGSGIDGHGTQWTLAANRADGNGGDGINVRGAGMRDDGGNHGENNGNGDAVQCVIAGAACRDVVAP